MFADDHVTGEGANGAHRGKVRSVPNLDWKRGSVESSFVRVMLMLLVILAYGVYAQVREPGKSVDDFPFILKSLIFLILGIWLLKFFGYTDF